MAASEALQQRFEAKVSVDRGQEIAVVPREKIVEALTHLRDQEGFDCLMDLTAVDAKDQGLPGRFAVVYNLCSFKHHKRFRVKAFVPEEDPSIASAVPVWPAAGWAERETFDLFGIKFTGHPDLRRILLPETFVHFPLRKEYPFRGLGERDTFEKYFR